MNEIHARNTLEFQRDGYLTTLAAGMNLDRILWLFGTSVLLTVSCMRTQTVLGRFPSRSRYFVIIDASSSGAYEDGVEIGIGRRRRRTTKSIQKDMKEVLRRRRAREESATAPMSGWTEKKMREFMKIPVLTKNGTGSFSSSYSSSSNTFVPVSADEQDKMRPKGGRRKRSKSNKLVYGVGYNDANYSILEKTMNEETKKWMVTWVRNDELSCYLVSTHFHLHL